MRRCVWLCVLAVSGLSVLGCTEQGPKTGKVAEVSPAIKPGAAAPADKKPAGEETKPKAPSSDAGSTTGGGTETPATPGEEK